MSAESTDDRGGPIVVGVDGSESARAAADRAAHLARSLGSHLHVVTAIKQGRHGVVAGPGTDTFVLDDSESARSMLQAMVESWPDVETTIATPEGRPDEVIIAEAERLGASMIVVGNRRMQGAGRLLGSVASDVAHHAPCDVLIANTAH
jgi:nucleotide-binding universal stress UspA family protein